MKTIFAQNCEFEASCIDKIFITRLNNHVPNNKVKELSQCYRNNLCAKIIFVQTCEF